VPPPATPTGTPAPLALVIEDFESYGSDEALRAVYSINDAWGWSVGQLNLASPPDVGSGNQGAAFHYEIKSPAPADYAGFERAFPAQDWRGHSTFRIWVKSDGSSMNLVIQFRESSGEVWRYLTNLSTFGVKDLRLPLNKATFHWADWSTQENGRIDLGAIDHYGIYVGHDGLGSGTIYLDDIRMTP